MVPRPMYYYLVSHVTENKHYLFTKICLPCLQQNNSISFMFANSRLKQLQSNMMLTPRL